MRPAKALALAAKVRSGRGYLSSESKPDFCTAVATSHNGFAALASLQLWLLIANMHDGQAKRGGAAATASASEDAAASTGAGACNANIGGADFALALDKAVACEDCSERSSNNRFSSSDKLSNAWRHAAHVSPSHGFLGRPHSLSSRSQSHLRKKSEYFTML